MQGIPLHHRCLRENQFTHKFGLDFLIKGIRAKKKKQPAGKSILIAIIAFILAIIFAAASPSSNKSDSNQEASESASSEQSISESEEKNDSSTADTSAVAEQESETSTTESQQSKTSETTSEESTASNNLTFEITAGELGDYGQELVLNEGTEFEDKTIGYFVPAGTYKITNIGDYRTQVNVYKNEKTKTEEGWEEWADGKSEALDVNASVEMTVEDGYFINVDEPTHISLEKVS